MSRSAALRPPSGEAARRAFGASAASYDRDFTDRPLGRWLRAAVWRHLGAAFRPGAEVLELGCGTGEDAIWLARRGVNVLATDVSPAMLAVAARKAARAGVGDRLRFAPLDLTGLGAAVVERRPSIDNWSNALPAPPAGPYDGAFSSFGPLNCVADRRELASRLAEWLLPGGRFVAVVMGPVCPWEIGWHLAHGEPRAAFRRFRSDVTAQVGQPPRAVRVWYPSPRRLVTELAPAFRVVATEGLGVLLPPSYLAHLVDRWPHLFARLAALERRCGRIFPATWLNDHYLIVFERR
ncbi:MAG: methyltransferase domain-containing protein [Chloroflexi bacterium]|nr:methyltransferase domain-containing protein [Chloroflexota bacterium]